MARLLLVLDHSTDRPERARSALEAALALQADGHEIRLWARNEGVRLAVRGVAETLREAGEETAAKALDRLAAGGALVLASRPCFERREFEADVLRPGATLAEPSELGRLVDAGWVPLPA